MLQAAVGVAAVTLTPQLSSDWPKVTAIICKTDQWAEDAHLAEIAITQGSNGQVNIASLSAKKYGWLKGRLGHASECEAAVDKKMPRAIVCIDGSTVTVETGQDFDGEGYPEGTTRGNTYENCVFQTNAATKPKAPKKKPAQKKKRHVTAKKQ